MPNKTSESARFPCIRIVRTMASSAQIQYSSKQTYTAIALRNTVPKGPPFTLITSIRLSDSITRIATTSGVNTRAATPR